MEEQRAWEQQQALTHPELSKGYTATSLSEPLHDDALPGVANPATDVVDSGAPVFPADLESTTTVRRDRRCLSLRMPPPSARPRAGQAVRAYTCESSQTVPARAPVQLAAAHCAEERRSYVSPAPIGLWAAACGVQGLRDHADYLCRFMDPKVNVVAVTEFLQPLERTKGLVELCQKNVRAGALVAAVYQTYNDCFGAVCCLQNASRLQEFCLDITCVLEATGTPLQCVTCRRICVCLSQLCFVGLQAEPPSPSSRAQARNALRSQRSCAWSSLSISSRAPSSSRPSAMRAGCCTWRSCRTSRADLTTCTTRWCASCMSTSSTALRRASRCCWATTRTRRGRSGGARRRASALVLSRGAQ